jgi:hypothetical protein
VTRNQFNQALRQLGLSVYASPAVLKVTLRQAQRYASGEQPVEARVAAILEMLVNQINGLKLRRRQLQMMIDAIDERGVRIGTTNRDDTRSWREQLRIWQQEIDDLLRNHPSGLPSKLVD